MCELGALEIEEYHKKGCILRRLHFPFVSGSLSQCVLRLEGNTYVPYEIPDFSQIHLQVFIVRHFKILLNTMSSILLGYIPLFLLELFFAYFTAGITFLEDFKG